MKKILSYIIIIGLFLVAGMRTAAIEARYKNNLLNVELSQTPDNRVSVLLVFEKPYTEPVKVIYKTDNEYNILLPETYHSITSVSTLNALNIRNASVKLVPYFNQDNSNGYTKITLQTTRPVVFNAHASYITTQIAQNDLIDKLEQDEEFKITPTTVKVVTNTVKKQAKTVSSKPKTQVKTATAKSTTVKSATKQAPIKPVQKVVQQPVKPVVAPKTPDEVKLAQSVEDKSIETKAQEKNIETQTPVVETVSDVIAEQQSKQSIVPEPIQHQSKYDIYRIAIEDKLPLIALILSLILLVGLVRNIFRGKKTVQGSSYVATPHFDYEPEQKEDIPQEIKDLSWQEKYKFMKEKEVNSNASFENSEINNQNNVLNEELVPDDKIMALSGEDFNTTLESVENLDPVIEPSNDSESVVEDAVSEGSYFDKESLILDNSESELFSENELEALNDISDIEPSVDLMYESAPDKEDIDVLPVNVEINETKVTNPLEPTLINQAKISKTKGFYLVRYEDEVALMGYINEQIFLLHSFASKQPTFIQTRLTEKKKGSEIYMIRAENFKSLVKVTKDNMQTLINL